MLYLDAQTVRSYFSVVRKQAATEKYLFTGIFLEGRNSAAGLFGRVRRLVVENI